MSSIEVIENKISAIKKYLGIIESYKKYSAKEIQDNIDIRGSVERYLYLASQATIDLAEAVIAYKNFRKPTTMRENFDILMENNIIETKLRNKLISMVGFRNIMAHDYEDVNYEIVHKVIHKGLKDIESFIDIITFLI